jgi:hypothetical protein
MGKHDKELLLMIGLKSLLVLGAGILIYMGLTSFMQKSDSWPPRDAEDEAKIIADYKHRLLIGDTPLTELKPETAALYIARIIDHAVKESDFRTAREYSAQAIDRKMQAEVEKAMAESGSRDLLKRTTDGRGKRDALKRIVDLYEHRPDPNAMKGEAGAKWTAQWDEALNDFRKTPFDPEKSPELAAEMEQLYLGKIKGWQSDPRIRPVIAEIEKSGLIR